MLINDKSQTTKETSGINEHDMELIKAFLQGAVYCWIKNRKDEYFALRDLVGGENTNWKNTPLEVLYQKHIDKNKDCVSANKVAGQDAGKILKLVLKNDKRKFKLSNDFVNCYQWIK